MPKNVKELKIFQEGLISNASSLDIPDEAAAYSENIDPGAEGGTLGGVAGDKILTLDGFKAAVQKDYYIKISEGWASTNITDADRKIAYRTAPSSDNTGCPDSSYLIVQTVSGLRNFVVSFDTEHDAATALNISDHKIRTNIMESDNNPTVASNSDGFPFFEEIPLSSICPDREATTVTTIGCNLYLDDTASNWTAAGFIPAFITKFVASWNAMQVNIDPFSGSTIGMSTFLKAVADVDNKRIILQPQQIEVDNHNYNHWGKNTLMFTTGNWPIKVGGTDLKSYPDQIVQVKKNTLISNWGSVASGATGSDANVTTIELEGNGGDITKYIDGSTIKIYEHPTIPTGNYTVIEKDNSSKLITIHGSYDSEYIGNAPSILENSDFSDESEGTDTTVNISLAGWRGEGIHNANSKFVMASNACTLTDDGTNTYCMLENTSSALNEDDSGKQRTYQYQIRIVANDVGGASAADARLQLGYHWRTYWGGSDRFSTYSHVDGGGTVEFREVGTYTGFFKIPDGAASGGDDFTVSRKDISGATNIKFDNLVVRPVSGFVELGVNTPPFENSEETILNPPLTLPSTELTTLFDGIKTDIVSFSANESSIFRVGDIDNKFDASNSVSLVEEGISHEGNGDFINHNKEFRLGLGASKSSTPLWGGYINRGQLEKELDDFYVTPQEVTTTTEELSGFNFKDVVTPYLPPADEMGKRWYQSQLIDMYQGITADASVSDNTTSADNFENPAYQTKLQANNLGAVNIDCVTADSHVLDLFDVGTSSANENRVTAALNNVVAGNGTSDLDTCVKPFTGLTFVISTLASSGADYDGIFRKSKRSTWYESATVAIGDVYMVNKLVYNDDNTCAAVDFLYMGNVGQGTGTKENGIGSGPAFGIGMSPGQQSLIFVNLWPKPQSTGSGSAVQDTITIPLKESMGDLLTGELTAVQFCMSHMDVSPTTASTTIYKKINKKYGTIIFAQNDSKEKLFKIDLHNAVNDNGNHGLLFPKVPNKTPVVYLDFQKIPITLQTPGKRIIDPNPWDPNLGDDSWDRIPKGAEITDIVETWSRRDISDTGRAFKYFNNDDEGNVRGSYEPNGSYLTWVMYTKKFPSETFDQWDMFLFNYESSGSTFAPERQWLNPDDVGYVYLKDRTPPYASVNKHIRDSQGTWNPGPDLTFYYNRERVGVSADALLVWNGGSGDDEYVSGMPGNNVASDGDGKHFLIKSNYQIHDPKKKSAWEDYEPGGYNGNHPEINLRMGNNLGWYNSTGGKRQIYSYPGTLARYEPRFEVVRDNIGTDPGSSSATPTPVVAHNQGHRVMFAGKVSGTFITVGGRMKAAKGYYGLVQPTKTWWSCIGAGSTLSFNEDNTLFTVKEVSCKTYENPTDFYGSGGECEYGTRCIGRPDASTYSKDDQNSSTISDHYRTDGDYIYINRLWPLERGNDFGGHDNQDVYSDKFDGTAENRTIGFACDSNTSDHWSNTGLSTTSIVYNGEGTANGDYTVASNKVTASGSNRLTQYNTMYQIDPLITMNKFENSLTNYNMGDINGMEAVMVWHTGTDDYETQFKRVLIVNGEAITTTAGGENKTFVAGYSINKHQAYVGESTSSAQPGNLYPTIAHPNHYIGYTGTLEYDTKGTNLKSTATPKASKGFTYNASSQPQSRDTWIYARSRAKSNLDCISNSVKMYDNSNLTFVNTTTHLQGLAVNPKTEVQVLGKGAYNPAIFGLSNDLNQSLYTKCKSSANAAYPSLLELENSSFANLGGVVNSASNDFMTNPVSETDNILTFNTATAGEGFSAGTSVYYKVSLMYDGVQESPLTYFTIKSPVLANSQADMNLTLNLTSAAVLRLSPRVTDINIYFTDELLTKPWTLAKSITLDTNKDNLWLYQDNKYRYNFTHMNVGPTYHTNNGISSNRRHTMVNWGIGTKMGNYFVYGVCSHKKISESLENYLFRSKAGRPDVVDWVNDYLILPTKPIAIESFKGKLYAWDSKNTYIINQEGFYVEDVLEGVGILNKRAVVVTDFGMCFADSNNIYLHDGVSATPIGQAILRNSLKRKWRVGYLATVEISKQQNHDISVAFDGYHNQFLIITKGFCGNNVCDINNQKRGARAFAYSLERKRWDYISVPNMNTYAQGTDNKLYFGDDTFLYESRTLRSQPNDWEWYSKDMTFGTDTQLKAFNKIKLTGRPSSVPSTNIRAYVDGVLKTLTVENRNYTSSATEITFSCNNSDSPVTLTYTGTNDDRTYAPSIRTGMYIKLDNEILLVTADEIDESTKTVTLTCTRAQLGTAIATHGGATAYILGPSYRFPSGTKGYKMRVELDAQKGVVDSIGIVYRTKSIK